MPKIQCSNSAIAPPQPDNLSAKSVGTLILKYPNSSIVVVSLRTSIVNFHRQMNQ
ncbi:MAG: hypothetical protein ACLFT9_22750 [Coleofasciculus sp.]